MNERKRLYQKRYRRNHAEELSAWRKTWRSKWSQRQRENARSWHRNFARVRSDARHKPVDAKTLARCRKNSQLAGSVAGTRRVVCLVCGRCYDVLSSHLRRTHGMSVSQYRTHRGLNAPVISLAHARAVGKARKRLLRDVRKRVAIYAKHHHRLADWPILEGIVAGKSHLAIGKEVHRTKGTIRQRAHLLGFPGGGAYPCVYDSGQRFDSRRFQRLRECSGLYAGQFATELGLPKEYGLHHFARRERSLARKVVPWRDRILSRLLRLNFSNRLELRNCSQASVLLALVPEIPSNYRLLLMVLKRLRQFLRENRSASLEEVRKYVCEEAIIETKERNREGIFCRFLPLAPEFIGSGARRGPDELRRDFERLRNRYHPAFTGVARDWLASRWGIKPYLVEKGLLGRSRIVPPERMRELILSVSSGSQAVATVEKPLKKIGRPAARKEKFRRASQMHQQGKTWRQIAEEISPGENPRAEAVRLQTGIRTMKAREKAHKKALSPVI